MCNKVLSMTFIKETAKQYNIELTYTGDKKDVIKVNKNEFSRLYHIKIMIRYITAPNFETISENDIVIFLAGPIQGSEDWHKQCYNFLKKEYERLSTSYKELLPWKPLFPNLVVCSPRRQSGIEKNEFEYKDQVLWETHHLRLAGKQGVVLFWFSNEKEQIIENGKIRPYAKTSRFEFGEWKTRHDLTGANVVLGLDTDWSKEKYFLTRIEQDGSDIPVCYTLEETAKESIKLCFNI